MADIQPSVLVRRLHAKLRRLTEVLLVITDWVEWRGSSLAAINVCSLNLVVCCHHNMDEMSSSCKTYMSHVLSMSS